MFEFDAILDNDIAKRISYLPPRLSFKQTQEDVKLLRPEHKLYPGRIREQAEHSPDEYPTVYYWPDDTMVVHWRPATSAEPSNSLDAYEIGRAEREDFMKSGEARNGNS